MIVGSVLASGEVVVSINVRGPGGQARIQAMVDTGFNEYLTLPSWVIERLKLPLGHQGTYIFGDGEQSQASVFLGEIEWHGSWRKIAIVEIEHDALLGTETVMGSNLNIDMTNGGRVEIRPLQIQGSPN